MEELLISIIEKYRILICIIYVIGFLFTFAYVRIMSGNQNIELYHDEDTIIYLITGTIWPIALIGILIWKIFVITIDKITKIIG